MADVQKPVTLDFLARKVAVIVYVTVVNFVVASHLASLLSSSLYRYDEQATYAENYTHLLANVTCIAVLAYALRQVSEIIPLPLESASFQPEKVKEVKTSVLTAFTLFLFLGEPIREFRDMYA